MESRDFLIYKDAFVELYHGRNEVILPLLFEERGPCVDLCLTDVPYNVSDLKSSDGVTKDRLPKGYTHKMRKLGAIEDMFADVEMEKGKRNTQTINRDMGDWDKEQFSPIQFLKDIFPLVHAGGQLVSFTSEMLMGDWMQTQFTHRALIFWAKSNPTPALPRMYQRPIEIAVWQTKGSNWTFNARGLQPPIYIVPSLSGNRKNNRKEPRVHPTQKPRELARKILAIHASSGQTIIDPFAGSGTFLRAAKDLAIKAIGIEQDERYAKFGAAIMRQEVLPIDWTQWEDLLLPDDEEETAGG